MGTIAVALTLSLTNCSSEEPSAKLPPVEPTTTVEEETAPTDPSLVENPFEAVPAYVYVAKVKNLLTGFAPTNEEIQAVVDDPGMLKQLIDVWSQTPHGKEKLREFLTLSFQQTQIASTDFLDMLGNDAALPGGAAGLANAQESFARTAMALIDEGRPFTDTATTTRFMMTPALMALYALIDVRHIDDTGRIDDKWHTRTNRTNAFRLQNTTPIPFEESIDPNSPNYMNFYTSATLGTDCTERVYNASRENSMRLASILFGSAPSSGGDGSPCNNNRTIPALITGDDFTSWRMVTIRKPNQGETPPDFWDVGRLRTATELVLDVPRVGFFTTPAFLANWRTNSSNQARVTVNQSLIVALGASFESEAQTIPLSETGLDTQHADPSTPCYACHKLLDPMRPYFMKNLTLNYHEQKDPKQIGALATFSFGTVQAQGGTLNDFGAAVATHTNFAAAWTQKLCFYADSASCAATDPEFLRVATAFQDSNFDFRVLLRELFSSPLVTAAAPTQTFLEREVVVSISRYDHFCRAIRNRLGIDGCNLNNNARQIAVNIPRDSYGRGSESPILTSDVSLFFRTSTENLCREIAAVAVDGSSGRYSSRNPDSAIADFVETVMGLPSIDPRAAPSLAILKEHYAAALASEVNAANSLRSTFVLACSSPPSVSIGL